MSFRFQKRIKLLPGVTVNLSKSGVSTSLGATGARVTLGKGKQRTTVGLPGTGISHTETRATSNGSGSLGVITFLVAIFAGLFSSAKRRKK